MTHLRLAALLLLAVSAAGAQSHGEWPHWRGPARTGVVQEPSGWAAGEWLPEKPAWTAAVGEGSSSPIVAGGRLYVMGWAAEKERVVCLDAATGKEVWKQEYPAPRYGRHAVGDQNFYSGASGTPELDPVTGLLYTLGIDGALHCWDSRKGGQKVWGLNLYDQYGVPRRPQATRRGGSHRDYGYTTAPLVHGGQVVVEVGDDEGTLMGFDARTGTRKWASECKWPAGHTAGLVPMTVEGVPCVAVKTLYGLLVARLDPGNEGKTVVEYEWITDFANNIPTPAVEGDRVILSSKYNQQRTACLRVSLKGAEKLWEQRIATGVCSPVIYKGHVYWAARGLHCMDLQTGALKWDGGRFGDVASCIVTGDGRVIIWANEGDLALAETAERSPDKYAELAFRPGLFRTEVWPHVVLADGRLYCKDRAGNIQCFIVGAARAGRVP